MHHVRFLEKVLSSGVVEWIVVWGVPRHNMDKFYDVCCERWPELRDISFKETF